VLKEDGEILSVILLMVSIFLAFPVPTVRKLTFVFQVLSAPVISPQPSNSSSAPKKTKDWNGITSKILESDKEKTTEEDPNVGGDSTLNGFFQKIFADSDEDTKRAMMKSYQESGGTHLSTNWGEVAKEKVPVSPPKDSEWKKWG
jgi:suppressor of G2 allele of SKP1